MIPVRVLLGAYLGLCIFAFTSSLQAEERTHYQTSLLWPEGAPRAIGTEDQDKPQLTILPVTGIARRSARSAVLILPGGGYGGLAFEREGIQAGRWANALGMTAFILRYRLAPRYHFPIEQEDGQRALRWIRSHASDYKIDPELIGVWGFSAGGHLASVLGTVASVGNPHAPDPIDRLSSRPAFLILAYAVIDPLGPAALGTFRNAVGGDPSKMQISSLSTDIHVSKDTPPTFLVASGADTLVFDESSVNFYLALRRAGVPAEMHLYQNGQHGFDLATLDPVLSSWTVRLADWLRIRGLLNTN